MSVWPRRSISKIIIERTLKLVTVTISTARPGIIIGKGGQEVDKLKEELKKLTGKEIQINIFEVKRPEVDAVIVGQNIARQLEGRVSFRRAVKTAVASTMRMGAEGIKIQVVRPCRRRRDGPQRNDQGGTYSAAHVPRRHRLLPHRGAHESGYPGREGVDLPGHRYTASATCSRSQALRRRHLRATAVSAATVVADRRRPRRPSRWRRVAADAGAETVAITNQ